MAFDVHTANIGLVKIGPLGNVINEGDIVSARLQFSIEHRIFPDSSNPNTDGYPTIETYLAREATDFYEAVHVDQYKIITVLNDISKIDSRAVDGLLGVEDSLAYKVEEIEKHLHNREYWYGQGGDGLADENNPNPWVITTGAVNVFGAEVQLSDGTQFPQFKYDMHQIFISTASANNSTYFLEFRAGGGAAFADASIVTTIPYRQANASISVPVDVTFSRQLSAENLWVRAKSQSNGATIQILIGLHSYIG